MRSASFVLALAALIFAAPRIHSQVLAPPEIIDPAVRALQEKHFAELKAAAVDITAHNYPYKFYLSRTLDLTEKQERQTDQRSIRFSQFQGHTVLQVTGNYFAAYSDQTMDRRQRFERTYIDVMLPIVRATQPLLPDEPQVTSLAIEVSHHVRKQVMGMGMERPENLVLIVPREAAAQLAGSKGIEDEIEVLSRCSEYVDGEPVALWGDVAPEKHAGTTQLPAAQPVAPTPAAVAPPPPPVAAAPTPPLPPRDLSAGELQKMQASCQALLDRMVRELDAQAHFVAYAPPALIEFRNASYLQLSIATTLGPSDSGSQYRMAALAFDRHVSHLIRPTLGFLEASPQFDGIVFSSTVRIPDQSAGAALSESVEYFFPISELRRYERYDITGQQLINAGFVLINGERVGLELQSAEFDARQ